MSTAERGSDQDRIWTYYLRSLETLDLSFAALQRAETISLPQRTSQFRGLSARDLDRVFREIRQELELEVCLALLASFEVILRDDFDARVHSRKSGPKALTDAFRALDRRTQEARRRGPALDQLLTEWKVAFPSASNTIGAFGVVVVNFRNWLAHGRSWSPKGHGGYDTTRVIKATQAVEQAIPEFPRLTDW